MDHQGIGVWLVPGPDSNIRIHLSEELWVALAALGWIGAVLLGLLTVRLVLP